MFGNQIHEDKASRTLGHVADGIEWGEEWVGKGLGSGDDFAFNGNREAGRDLDYVQFSKCLLSVLPVVLLLSHQLTTQAST